MAPTGQFYKIKLSSGRILGPLDLERIRLFVLKNKIVGTETAREYPQGEWKDINLIPEIAEILIAHASDKLKEESIRISTLSTETNSQITILPGAAGVLSVPEKPLTDVATLTSLSASLKTSGPSVSVGLEKSKSETQKTEATQVTGTVTEIAKTEDPKNKESGIIKAKDLEEATPVFFPLEENKGQKLSEEKTVVFQRSGASPLIQISKVKKGGLIKIVQWLTIFVVVAIVAQDFLFQKPDKRGPSKVAPFRPQLPEVMVGNADPALSAKIFGEALPHYLSDTVSGYKSSAEKFMRAIKADNGNIKAIALLASCYLNLIDSSNKDENYFSVITKLLDQARAKSLDLPETVISDVEFYITINRPEAAQNRIVEHTKLHKDFDLSMFYYLSLTFFYREDIQSAATFVSRIPENKIFSPKVYYLRGLIAEKLKDSVQAQQEYLRAIKINPKHAKSRLRLADLMAADSRLREAGEHLEFLVENPFLLNPKELARAYYLHTQLNELSRKWDLALGDIERAVKLDKDNHDYLLELYTLRAKAGESLKLVQKEARMYFYLGEGEKALKQGNYQDALALFLQARQANLDSILPLLKIGDMFFYLNDVSNAKLNFELAAKRAPKNVDVWSKYINVLIQSYEWEEAQKAMDKFRMLPVSQSAIDKAAGDMFARQARFVEAQAHYRKAMGRDSIDPSVYIAYARSLMATKNFKDAPFFFALALRYDPLNIDALIGTAKCVAATDSIDRGINMLLDELKKRGGARAELLTAIAELEIQRGRWGVAQKFVDQAIEANPEFAFPWKLQGQIYMSREGQDKEALDKALASYKSYSDRNASDPSGYLERYRIFIKKSDFEKASDELARIYGIYPKYPNLHFYKGALYVIMGNHKAGVEEYTLELKNNPNSVNTMMALGKGLIELGSPREAIIQFTRAMQLASQSAEPKHWAAYAHYLLKNYSSAIALYQSALSIDPANPLIFKRMGLAYWDMGDPVSAKNSFKKYLEMEPDAPDRAEFERF